MPTAAGSHVPPSFHHARTFLRLRCICLSAVPLPWHRSLREAQAVPPRVVVRVGGAAVREERVAISTPLGLSTTLLSLD